MTLPSPPHLLADGKDSQPYLAGLRPTAIKFTNGQGASTGILIIEPRGSLWLSSSETPAVRCALWQEPAPVSDPIALEIASD